MSWTKLEFDQQERVDELTLIAKALKGMKSHYLRDLQQTQSRMPSYPTGDAVDIVADYLTRVRECAIEELVELQGRHVLSTIPVDIVVTIPAVSVLAQVGLSSLTRGHRIGQTPQ